MVIFLVIMARHTFLRGKYFLHIFQQMGYKFNEFWQWMVDHWNQRILTAEHFLYLVIISGMLWFASNAITGSAAIIIISLFGIFWFGPFTYYSGEGEKKPLVFTPRMIRLTVPFALLSASIPLYLTYLGLTGHLLFTDIQFDISGLVGTDIYILSLGWILGNAVVPGWIFLAGKITEPIENYIHEGFKKQARQKLAHMPDLRVVAITGSYGKTSTKFMIRDLLKERMSVCVTPGSYNTPMGICKVINDDLQAHHQVLVLEMGARYEGNIDELCDIAEPDISVITNVGVAHLETFGSKEAIARTKSTIVRRLKSGGTAVLNFDDPLVRKMAGMRDDVSIIKVGLDEGAICASDISYNHEGTRFTLHTKEGSEDIKTRLLGVHNVQNLLLAAGVASIFGIRLKTMALAASKMEPVEHRLELKKQGQLYIIDDAFNSNPTGAKNAVEILSQFDTGRRIIVTPGMIELGELEVEKNRKLGEVIGKAGLDLVILVGEEQTKPIRQGLQDAEFDPEKIRVVSSLFKANEIIEEYAGPGDVVLYENDLPDTYSE